MPDTAPRLILAERGRKQPQYSSATEAYFEVVSLPPETVTEIEVYALDESGSIIGSGTERHRPYFQVGQVFGLTLYNTGASKIVGWLAQVPSGGRSSLLALSRALDHRAASSAENLAAIGSPKHRPFEIKGAYSGEVHVHKRTRVFHRPDCSNARALDAKNRIILPSPDKAQQEHYVPCFSCMLDLRQ